MGTRKPDYKYWTQVPIWVGSEAWAQLFALFFGQSIFFFMFNPEFQLQLTLGKTHLFRRKNAEISQTLNAPLPCFVFSFLP